jgi:hypothetical protein
MNERFHPPVPVALKRVGTVRNVASTREVAEMLMDPLWPCRGGAHRRACEIALARYENPGVTSVVDVRNAFAEAADEAGILVETTLAELEPSRARR